MDAQKSADEPTAIDATEARRRRLRYRAWHRGTKEMDLVLGPYADAHLPLLGPAELDRLEALMEEADTDLLKWVMGQETPPQAIDRDLLARLIDFRQITAASR
jgi:antitoxin CptB